MDDDVTRETSLNGSLSVLGMIFVCLCVMLKIKEYYLTNVLGRTMHSVSTFAFHSRRNLCVLMTHQ